MNVQQIVSALCDSPKGVTRERIVKAERLARVHAIPWSTVLAAMNPEQRQQVTDVVNA
jgi:hypothetical protein